MSIAAAAAQQAGAATGSAASAAAADSATRALGKLSDNFDGFLKMLMTQLQNQDPTSPMDTNQFTTELVQFSSVEQQITMNASLTKLIEMTQAGEVMQASSMIGKQVTVASDHVPLQNGHGIVQFTAPAAQPVEIGIYSDAGAKLQDITFTVQKGANTWIWDGKDARGKQMPDGAYKIALAAVDTKGQVAALPFSVTGTATGVTNSGSAIQLQLGGQSVDFSAVRSVGN